MNRNFIIQDLSVVALSDTEYLDLVILGQNTHILQHYDTIPRSCNIESKYLFKETQYESQYFETRYLFIATLEHNA